MKKKVAVLPKIGQKISVNILAKASSPMIYVISDKSGLGLDQMNCLTPVKSDKSLFKSQM